MNVNVQNFPPKATLYKTCKHEGEYASIVKWFKDGDSFMFLIRKGRTRKELVHMSECSEFCL